MDKEFEQIALRAAALRLTENELIPLVDPPMPYVTYWRAKTGVTSLAARVKALRRVESTLDELERKKFKVVACGQCDLRTDDPRVRQCTRTDCGVVTRAFGSA
ncbi:MAG: hypothetical protein ACRCYS_11480 [Beijerinckiaceae bacterium]